MHTVANETLVRLHMFDVGHGDSLLLEFCGTSRVGIVDCHRHKASNPLLEELTRLKEADSDLAISFLCITHPHYDHYGGIADIVDWALQETVSIRSIWLPSLDRDSAILFSADNPEEGRELTRYSRTLDRLLQAVPHADFAFLENNVAPQKDPAWGDLVNIRACAPEQVAARVFYLQGRRCLNELSAGLVLEVGGSRIFLSGDMCNNSWASCLSLNRIPRSLDVLKVSHHGSLDGNTPLGRHIAEYISPKGDGIALISGGYRPHLPHAQVVNGFGDSSWTVQVTGHLSATRQSVGIAPGSLFPTPRLVHESLVSAGTVVVDISADGAHLAT